MEWYDILQKYEFDKYYRPGTKMLHVDALSRDQVSDQEGETLDEVLAGWLDMCFSLKTEDKVQMAQNAYEELLRFCKILQKPEAQRTKAEKGLEFEYSLEGRLLYRWYQGQPLFVIPRSIRKSIVVAAHDLGGYLSVDKTVTKITQDF